MYMSIQVLIFRFWDSVGDMVGGDDDGEWNHMGILD
jgi:hypothetical protein